MKGLISMYYNEKRKAITAKYVKTHLDDIKIRVPKGQREKLKSIASEMGMSMNQMFIKAVEEYIEKNYKPEAESETDWQIGIFKGDLLWIWIFHFLYLQQILLVYC